jgi:hypothetical protein
MAAAGWLTLCCPAFFVLGLGHDGNENAGDPDRKPQIDDLKSGNRRFNY